MFLLVRARGRGAMDDVLAQPLDLSDILWEMLTAGKTFDTPARQAGLEAEIGKLTRQIPDERVRAHYSRYMRRRLNDLVGVPNSRARISGYSGRDWGGNKGQNQFRGEATSSLKNSLIGRVGANPEPRERSLVLTLLSHPGLLSRYGEEFAMIEFLTPELDKLRNEIIRIAVENPALDREVLKRQLNEEGCGELLERAIGGGSAPPEWFTSPDAATQDAETGLNILLKRQYQAMLHKQLVEAKIAYIADESPKNWKKFTALQRTVQAAEGDEADIAGFGQASGHKII
ncbi:MAG TPA: hypothetical protein EYQ81_06420 [Sneathiellales bacterium]|nr:hypothetical protein [Sneathiellales bacterium]